MLATNITPSVSNNTAIGSCDCQSDQQVSANDASRFSQLMGQNAQGVQGNQPPPPPPPGDTETAADFSSTQQGQGRSQCQDAESSSDQSDLSDLSSSEDLMSILSQLLSSLQSIDLSSLSDSDSSLLNGTFDDFSSYFDQSYGSFS